MSIVRTISLPILGFRFRSKEVMSTPIFLQLMSEAWFEQGNPQVLAKFARVNKTWRDIMLSTLYRSLPKRKHQPPTASLRVNSFRVRVLTFKNGAGGQNTIPAMNNFHSNAIQFPNVVELNLRFYGADDAVVVKATDIMRTINGLRNLRLEDVAPLLDRNDRWSNVLSTCRLSLSTLFLINVLLNDDATGIVCNMPLLSTLNIASSQFGNSVVAMPSVLHLTLHPPSFTFSQQLRWFLCCPNLTSLRWDIAGASDTEVAVNSAALAGQTLPSLKVIHLENEATLLSDSFVGLMLNTAGPQSSAPRPQLEAVTITDVRFWFR